MLYMHAGLFYATAQGSKETTLAVSIVAQVTAVMHNGTYAALLTVTEACISTINKLKPTLWLLPYLDT